MNIYPDKPDPGGPLAPAAGMRLTILLTSAKMATMFAALRSPGGPAPMRKLAAG